MTNHARIVVGLNPSEPARSAVQWAAMRAIRDDAELTLTHVVDPRGGLTPGAMLDSIVLRSTQWLSDELDNLRSQHPAVDSTAEIRTGRVPTELLAAAAGASILVIGTHKTGYIQGRIFGSMGLRLAGVVDVPLAVIPQSWTRRRSGTVVGLGARPHDDGVLVFAKAEARRARDELVLVHAWQPPEWMDDDSEADLLFKESLDSDPWDQVGELSHPDSEGIRTKVRTRTIRRPTGAALLEAATNASTLVIGDAREPDGSRQPMGSTVRDVMLNLTSPTIVVPTTRER